MVDNVQRKRLSEDLRHLAAGTITNDEFADAYFDHYAGSVDHTVRVLGKTGYCLFDDMRCYRLRGRDALNREGRRIVARCILFLRNGLEYQWPRAPMFVIAQVLDALGALSLLCGGILLPLGFWGLTTSRDRPFWSDLIVLAAAMFAFGLWCRWEKGLHATLVMPRLIKWRTSGDYDVWPFFRREDFYRARLSNHLLGAATESPASAT